MTPMMVAIAAGNEAMRRALTGEGAPGLAETLGEASVPTSDGAGRSGPGAGAGIGRATRPDRDIHVSAGTTAGAAGTTASPSVSFGSFATVVRQARR